MHPSELLVADGADRWTAYQIGQRVGEHYSKLDRVFLAGGMLPGHRYLALC